MAIKIALAGNPNCGKTTLFNALTGSNQYVGNWPGVTVEKKDGKLKTDKTITIQDLPGIYSLSPYTMEEVVTRQYLVSERPDAIINIIDATNLERNLYLTTQLLELHIPTIIALNMMDIVNKNGDRIDVPQLSKELGCPIVPISALKGDGSEELIDQAVKVAKKRTMGDTPHVYSGSVEHAIAHIEESIEDKVSANNLRWYAVKFFERDEKVREEIKLGASVLSEIEGHIEDCEKEMDDDAESIIINQRYEYINSVVPKAIERKQGHEKLTLSDKIDRIVTNRVLALPIFALVMFLVYYISVTTIGDIVTGWTNDVFVAGIQDWASNGLTHMGASDWVISLVSDGIIGGLGAPIGFAPQMAIVFFFLALLEDCGYMARVAFIMDRIFRRFGLSGKSFIPFLISSGCGVPGIMSTRTIESEKDRHHHHSMWCKTSGNRYHRRLHRRRCMVGSSGNVLPGHWTGYRILHYFEEDKDVRGRSGSVCYGTSGIPRTVSKGRAPQRMGKSMGVPEESGNHPVPLLCGNVVLGQLWFCRRKLRSGGRRRFAAGGYRRRNCFYLQTTGIRNMAGCCVLPVRFCGKRRYRIYHGRSVRTGRDRGIQCSVPGTVRRILPIHAGSVLLHGIQPV